MVAFSAIVRVEAAGNLSENIFLEKHVFVCKLF